MEIKIGYHASHEQFSPSHLLSLAQMAQQAGFDTALSSDHIVPWSERQGNSGYSWAWLGAAMQKTGLDYGVVCAPGQRYHPAIIAQAAATLAEMFPGRFWLAAGSGQLINESVTGERWPPKWMRNERLRESVDVIRRLWAGEEVTHYGHVNVEHARLYVKPKTPPLLVGAAITPQTAEWVGGWADALITISKPHDQLREVVDAFRRGGGEGKPMFLKVQLSYSNTDQNALQGAYDQWRTVIFDSPVLTDLRFPWDLDAAGSFVTPEQVREHVRVSDSPHMFVDLLGKDVELGFERLYLHNVNKEQEPFIEVFGETVVPQLRNIFRG
ncbi:hypothetical protein CHISP_3019 [Chitinispirillum alkaliphilum]|nr:hypothetical protein CHISP_3019 [Chitinispirillum alkaliphilum]